MLNVYAIEQGTHNKYDNGKELTTFSYVYLHGELDDEIGFDIVAIEVDELNNLTESGIYEEFGPAGTKKIFFKVHPAHFFQKLLYFRKHLITDSVHLAHMERKVFRITGKDTLSGCTQGCTPFYHAAYGPPASDQLSYSRLGNAVLQCNNNSVFSQERGKKTYNFLIQKLLDVT